jgi:hypothetical protein
MTVVVLVVWLVQAASGVALLSRRLGQGRPSSLVVSHVVLSIAALGCWAAFVVRHAVVWGWFAFALVTAVNTVGDAMLIGRSRRLAGRRGPFFADYGAAIRATVRGRLPRRVTFHALFAGAAYFTALAACISASLS